MSIRYTKIRKRPMVFLKLFGVSVCQFDEFVEKLHPIWDKKVLGSYKRPGRHFKLSLEEMVLIVLLYYRSYVTQLHVGFLFGLDDSRVCRIIRLLEPLLASVFALSKHKEITAEEIDCLIIDATEQPIERPKKGQRKYYSGKKKRHTLKTEVRVRPSGRIVHVSKSRGGSVHDYTLFKEGPPLPEETRVYVDSAYQGYDKIHPATEVPYKKTKNKPLDDEEKLYNQALSRVRVKIENVFAQIKTFKILADRYRNKRKRYNLKFTIIAGIVNFKNGFA